MINLDSGFGRIRRKRRTGLCGAPRVRAPAPALRAVAARPCGAAPLQSLARFRRLYYNPRITPAAFCGFTAAKSGGRGGKIP
jgi:hypothetical protein